MPGAQVTFPNQYTIALPAQTIAAIEQAKAKYTAPLWQFRPERRPETRGASMDLSKRCSHGSYIIGHASDGHAWHSLETFQSWVVGGAEAYFVDTATYPTIPAILGRMSFHWWMKTRLPNRLAGCASINIRQWIAILPCLCNSPCSIYLSHDPCPPSTREIGETGRQAVPTVSTCPCLPKRY